MSEEESGVDPELSAEAPAAPAAPHTLEYASATPRILQYSGSAAKIDDWTHVYRAADTVEANLMVGKLQEAGLHARTDMENTTALGSWGFTGYGGTNVQVLQSEIERAREVIDEIERIRE